MDKPTTRLDIKKHRKTLREIGSLRRSNLPEKVKNRLRIRALACPEIGVKWF
jgi:hypothetical protein